MSACPWLTTIDLKCSCETSIHSYHRDSPFFSFNSTPTNDTTQEFLSNLSNSRYWNLENDDTTVPNNNAGPTQTSKYFNRSCSDTLRSSKFDICLPNAIHVVCLRFLVSNIFRLDADVESILRRYRRESSSYNIFTNSPFNSTRSIDSSLNVGLHRKILVFFAFSVSPIFSSSLVNDSVIDNN